MKRNFQRLVASVLFLLSPCIKAVETFTIDPQHSHVLFHINHFGFSNPSGKWMAQGKLEYDKNNLKNSKVDVTIKVAEMITGIEELNKHLKGKLFFEVDKFPTATFVSDKVDAANNQINKISGILTVHGISKPVILNVKLNKIGINPINDQETIGFSANTQLKRSDFGINTALPGLGDDVTLDIEVEAFKPKAK